MEILFGKRLADDRHQWCVGPLVSSVEKPAADQRDMERLEIIPLHEVGRSNQETLSGRSHMSFRGNQPSLILTDNRNVGREAYRRHSWKSFYPALQLGVKLVRLLLCRVVVDRQGKRRGEDML